MKKIISCICFVFVVAFSAQSQEVRIKKCKTCGKPIKECRYKGKHPSGPTYIQANGSTTLNLQLSSQASIRTISVTTDASSYTTYGIPSWCSVEAKTSSQFTLRINENTSTSARSDWMEIRTSNGKSARINISQNARPANNGTYIKIDGNTTVNKTYSATGTTETFYITTDADDWSTWGVPSWCTVENKTSSSFRLRVNENTSSDSRSDYMEVRTANGTSARLNISQSPANYLRVDGYTTTRSSHFSENGGTETFSVSTSASAYEVVLLPSWCQVESKSSSSFTIRCERNNSSSERSDWFKVKAAGKEIRIDVRQDAVSGPSAVINSVTIDHNVFNGMVKGMKIHVSFDVNGMNGRSGYVRIQFYQGDNTTPLHDPYYNALVTKHSWRSNYDNCTWPDYEIFVPYTYLNMAPGYHNLSFDVSILNSAGTQMARKENFRFTYSR